MVYGRYASGARYAPNKKRFRDASSVERPSKLNMHMLYIDLPQRRGSPCLYIAAITAAERETESYIVGAQCDKNRAAAPSHREVRKKKSQPCQPALQLLGSTKNPHLIPSLNSAQDQRRLPQAIRSHLCQSPKVLAEAQRCWIEATERHH